MLITAIRLSKKRLVPAIKKRQAQKPAREFVMRYVRVFSVLKEIPISRLKNKYFFLDAHPSPNSKAFAVVDELTKAAISKTSIYTPSQKKQLFVVILRVLYGFFSVLPLLFRIFRRKTNLDVIAMSVVFGYAVYKEFLKKNKQLVPIIISDITPHSHMLWAAAASLNRDVLWWQDDYHHYNGVSKENYLPYDCTHAAVLNQKGFETVLAKSPNAEIFYRKQTKVKPLRSIPENPSIGLATNAFFEATEQQIKLLKQIKEQLKVLTLKIRLHPNSKLIKTSFPDGLLEIAPKDESIEAFAKSVDLAIVGNSAVQLKLLCEGLPVVHIAGLDRHGFDVYKYCNIGFSFGLENIQQLKLGLVQKFYSDPLISNRLSDYVNIKNLATCQPLSKLNKNIA